MTEEQIIKGLECCTTGNMCEFECPYNDGKPDLYECTADLAKDALDLIKRQREEIARARAEAMREFADWMSTHIGLLEARAEEDCAEGCRFLQNATIELHAKWRAYREVRKCIAEGVRELTEEQK
jgi:hypothetical protein